MMESHEKPLGDEPIVDKSELKDKEVKKFVQEQAKEVLAKKKTKELLVEQVEQVEVGVEVGAEPEDIIPIPVVVKVEKGASELIEKVISINRITKVTKGGKKLSFSALVVVGDAKGNVGYSLSKAKEVSVAIRKAIAIAKQNMIKIPMEGSTITHEIIGQCGGARVLLKPALEGTGVIAAGPVRAVCDGAGIHNILTKCHRSNNPINVVKATIDGLTRLKSRKVKAGS